MDDDINSADENNNNNAGHMTFMYRELKMPKQLIGPYLIN